MFSIRHQSRMAAVQILYEWDLKEKKESLEDIFNHFFEINQIKIDPNFVKDLIHGVEKNIEEIDKLIEKTAPEWPIEQIAVIDKTILRLGIYELLFAKEVPPKAVINEAVELGKEFGSENSGKFVNGVLGTLYREKVEPNLNKES